MSNLETKNMTFILKAKLIQWLFMFSIMNLISLLLWTISQFVNYEFIKILFYVIFPVCILSGLMLIFFTILYFKSKKLTINRLKEKDKVGVNDYEN